MVIAITGASGVGKTTILKELSKRISGQNTVKVFHFDDMDLPNWEEIEDVEKWQEEATLEWIDKLVEIARNEQVHILFEGSTDIKFYIQGFKRNNFPDYQILLFDCTQETMRDRLIERGQPELYQSQMIGWLNYLREEATLKNIEIIKTDEALIAEIGNRILKKLNVAGMNI